MGVKPGRREKTHAVCLSDHVWEGTGEALECGGFGQGEFAEEGVGGGWRVGGMCKLPDGRIIRTEVVVMGEDEKPENWMLRKKDDEALTQDQRCQPGSPLIDPPSTHLQRTGRPFPSSLQNLNPQSLSFPTSSQHSHHLLHMPFPLPSPRTSRSSGRMSVAGSPRTPPSMNGDPMRAKEDGDLGDRTG